MLHLVHLSLRCCDDHLVDQGEGRSDWLLPVHIEAILVDEQGSKAAVEVEVEERPLEVSGFLRSLQQQVDCVVQPDRLFVLVIQLGQKLAKSGLRVEAEPF